MLHTRRARPFAAALPLIALSLTACDIVSAGFRHQESTEWRRTYDVGTAGVLEIGNVNGKIDVRASSGASVEVVATKIAKAASPEAAKQALERIEIVEDASAGAVKIETRVPRGGGMFNGGSAEVRYEVRLPPGTRVRATTTNGGIELAGITGDIRATTTNGGIRAREIAGAIEATTTNGGVDVEITRVTDAGVQLECTNGGIRLSMPAEAKASISAQVTNGGIDADGRFALDASESSRRRLEARLNGGGPAVRLSGTNGGIRLTAR